MIKFINNKLYLYSPDKNYILFILWTILRQKVNVVENLSKLNKTKYQFY